MVGLGPPGVGDDEVARVFGDDVSAVEGDGPAAGAGHLTLVAVVVEQPVGQHEPSFLISLQPNERDIYLNKNCDLHLS